MGGSVAVLVLALLASAEEPPLDDALEPSAGMSFGVGVQRLQDEFGLTATLASPRFLGQKLAFFVAGGIGWYPDLRALPMNEDQQDFGAWSPYGHARAGLEVSTRIARSAGRLYAVLGPSFLLLAEQVSTTRLAIGGYGAVGVELFAGDAFQAHPVALWAEIGGVAHAAAADVASRTGPIEETDGTVDRPIGTGLAISAGLRIYFWR